MYYLSISSRVAKEKLRQIVADIVTETDYSGETTDILMPYRKFYPYYRKMHYYHKTSSTL